MISWEKIDHVLLTADEEHALAFFMTPLKGMENLRKRQREEMASKPIDEDLASAAGMKLRTFQQLPLSNAARNKFIQHKQSIKQTSMDLLMEKERDPTHNEIMSRLGLGYSRYCNILQTSIRPGSMQTQCRITVKN